MPFATLLAQAEETARKELVVGGYRMPFDTPPYFWLSPCDGGVDGSMPHLLRKYLAELGYELRFTDPATEDDTIDFAATLGSIKAGKYDAAPGLYKGMGAPEIVTGKEPVIMTNQAAVHLKRLGEIKSLEELKGARGLVAVAGRAPETNNVYQYLSQGGYQIQATQSGQESYRLLLEGRSDYLVSDYYRALLILREQSLEDRLSVVRIKPFGLGFYMGVKTGSPWEPVLAELDIKLREGRQAGFEEAVNRSYLRRWVNRQQCE